MSRNTDSDNLNEQAFEYVIGTLRGDERRALAKEITRNSALAHHIHYWEEQLMALPEPGHIQPIPGTWDTIAARLNPEPIARPHKRASVFDRLSWSLKNWLIPATLGSVASVLAMLVLMHFSSQSGSAYVAVLNDANGLPALTAITQGETAQMRIQWQAINLGHNKNLQLWAISKQDGQPRSIAVFPAPNGTQLVLDTPQLRLIKDADSLLLTEEDVGGSAIDEPSPLVVAKGICVRIAAQ
jgi:anti-sigma-K factor RskA